MKTRGRNICDTLKAIRKEIADANGIEYSPEECHFKGECRGTCPKCEQEVKDLEYELRLRQMAGTAIKVAGVAAGIVAMTACSDGKIQRTVSDNAKQWRTAVIKPTADPDSSKIFGAAEEMPSFPGGEKALMQYIKDNTYYPEEMCEGAAQGRVMVGFVINEDGSISDVKVLRSLTPELDEVAVKIVKGMPKWNPGKQNGKAVKTKYTVPVSFRTE
ncbi:energy transducer TonB [Prevotella sp.]|uniref:energy transducer TonB n=1 Tax=Prevotella sp. TaxID=59823 RepID=UPI003AB5A618